MLQTKHVDIIPPLLKTCMLQTKHTCQHETKGESVVYPYSFSNPRTEVHCHQQLPAYGYQFYSVAGTLIHLFLGESPHHLHTLVRVAPPHHIYILLCRSDSVVSAAAVAGCTGEALGAVAVGTK